MNFIFFSTSDDFNTYHRKREVNALAHSTKSSECNLLFNRPVFFLRKFFNLKKIECDNESKLVIRNLYILLPLKIAMKNVFLRFFFIDLPIRLQIYLRKTKLLRKNTPTYLVYYKPDQYVYLPKTNGIYINYDNYKMDNNYYFSKNKNFDSVLNRCINDSFLALFTSNKLLKEKSQMSSRSLYYYPNAIDRDMVNLNIREPILKNTNSGDIVIGFVGQIDDSFDEDLLEKIASNFKRAKIKLIGPVTNEKVFCLAKDYPNIQLIGFVKYELLGRYICDFDVGICPYKNNVFNGYRNPLKVYEYFSYGKPVVTVDCDIDMAITQMVSVSKNTSEFINNISREYQTNNSEKVKERQVIAQNNCWDNRADFLLKLIEKKNEERI